MFPDLALAIITVTTTMTTVNNNDEIKKITPKDRVQHASVIQDVAAVVVAAV